MPIAKFQQRKERGVGTNFTSCRLFAAIAAGVSSLIPTAACHTPILNDAYISPLAAAT